MQLGLLALLGGLILLACFCYWLGFRARPRPAWAWKAQAGLLVTSLVLIPTVSLTLYFQPTATPRLRHLGVVPHPALSSSVGLALGLGSTPTFLSHSQSPTASVMSFYRGDSTRPGWTLTEESGGSMVFRQAATCTHGPVLPAYAHNDYVNPHPLYDALELGFRGVEADILLRGGELRVGHDASAARPGRNLEALYLHPLRLIVQQCGHVLTPSIPFLLNVELKERSPAAYDSLIGLLERYADLFEPSLANVGGPPVDVILVGWHPKLAASIPDLGHQPWRQQRITTLSPGVGTESSALVRLVSLDYGNTIGWSGRGPPPDRAARWLGRLRTAKGEAPGRLSRAYNVPVDAAVYRLLLEAGVDLIGTKHLVASQQVLRTVIPASPSGR